MAEVPPELAAELQKLERYHAENPEGRYFVPLANAYRKVGEVEQAEALLREGLRRHPEYLSAHIVLGRCLAERGAVGEAAEEFRYVLSVDPQNLIALRSLGDLASERGEGGEAARWYRELLAVDPMNDEARQALEVLEAEEAVPSALAAEEDFEGGAGWWEPPAEEAAPGEEEEEEAAAWGEIRLEGTEDASELAEPAPAPDLYGTVDLDALELPAMEEEAPAPAADLGGWDPFGEGGVELSAEVEEQEEELVTETIAELYARQGFHDRAAEVYRELIRRRGEEPALVRRLAEMEAGAAADEQAAQEVVAEVAEETVAWGEIRLEGVEAAPAPEEPEPAVDAFAASFETGFGGAPTEPAVAVEEAVALAEEPPAEESFPAAEEFALEEPAVEEPAVEEPAAAGGTVRDYLSALVAWSPAAPSAAPVAEEAAAEEPSAEPEEVVDEEMEMPWLAPAPEPAAEGGEEVEAEESFPWELSPELSTVEAAAPEAEEAEEGGFSFEDFFVETPEEAAPGVEAAEPRAAEAAPEPEPAAEGAGEDEDLESFQAWLQSLKR